MSDLLVRVALDQSGVDAQLKGLSKKFANAAKAFAAVTVPAAAVLGVAKAVDMLAALGEEAIKSAGALQDAADMYGVTAEKLQELRIIGKQAGVDFAQMDKALGILNRTVGQAALGQGNFEEVLGKAGIQLRNSEGKVKSVSTVWDELSKAVRSGSLSQAQSVALAASAFGREGGRIVNVLRQTEEQQRAIVETAREFGAVISNEVVASMDAYGDKLDLIKQGTEALRIQSDAALAPLTLKWAKLKNEIAFTSAELLRAAGLIDDTTDLQKRRADGLAERIKSQVEYNERLGQDPAQDILVQKWTKEWAALTSQIDAAKRKREESAAAVVPGASMDDVSDPVESDKQAKDRERIAKESAAYELELITDVAAERARVALDEIELEKDYANVLYEEREKVYTDELAQLQQWNEILTEERTRAADMELEQYLSKEGLLTEARKQGQQERLKFDQMATGLQVATVLDSLSQMTAGVAQHNKTMFNLNKAAAIGSAIVNTAQGVTKALAEYPPPVSFAMAAAQGAAGLAQVQAIRSTQYGGGGKGTTPSAAATPVVNSQPQAQERIVNIRGVNPAQMFSGRQLVDLINEASKDGAKLRLES